MKKNVKNICCNNAGGKQILEESCMNNLKEIKFDLTSPGTLQYNGLAEQGRATLYFRMSPMMTNSQLYKHVKTGLWP